MTAEVNYRDSSSPYYMQDVISHLQHKLANPTGTNNTPYNIPVQSPDYFVQNTGSPDTNEPLSENYFLENEIAKLERAISNYSYHSNSNHFQNLQVKQQITSQEFLSTELPFQVAYNDVYDPNGYLKILPDSYHHTFYTDSTTDQNLYQTAPVIANHARNPKHRNNRHTTNTTVITSNIPTGNFINPVDGNFRISSGFGLRRKPRPDASSNHQGLDMAANRGTTVIASDTGTVAFAGRKGGYGNVVIIDHGDGITTRYGHLSSINVEQGKTVGQGVKIGEVGSTGTSTGNHLHFEIRRDGRAINPIRHIGLA